MLLNCTKALELCFLVILSATTLYSLGSNNRSDGIICKCASASISVSLVMFIGILSYHTYLRVNKTRWFTQIKDTILAKWQVKMPDAVPAEETSSSNVLNFLTTTSVKHFWPVVRISNSSANYISCLMCVLCDLNTLVYAFYF